MVGERCGKKIEGHVPVSDHGRWSGTIRRVESVLRIVVKLERNDSYYKE